MSVFVLHTETDYLTDEDTTTVVRLATLKRGKDFVQVERCAASRYRTRLYPDMFYENKEDAVAAYAERVKVMEKSLTKARDDLQRMRDELAGKGTF